MLLWNIEKVYLYPVVNLIPKVYRGFQIGYSAKDSLFAGVTEGKI